MRVAFDVGPLGHRPAGVGMYIRSLAVELAQLLSNDELVLIGHRPDAAGLPVGPRILDRRPGIPYPAWSLLVSAHDARRAGATIFHSTDALVPVPRPAPTVVTVQDISLIRRWRDHRVVRYPRIPLLLAAVHLADHVIVPSQATADELMGLARLPAKRITVVPLAPRIGFRPLDADTVAAVLKTLDLAECPYILSPGTIEPRKNHVRLIRAFSAACDSGSIPADTQLVIAGAQGWGTEPVIAEVEASPHRDAIRMLGYVGDEAMQALTQGATAVAYVSLYEGFGLPILEAMRAGAPVVTSDASSMSEVAGDAAVLVDPTDIDAIATGLAEVCRATDADRARAAAHAAEFTWSRTARETLEVYRAMDRGHGS